MFYISLKAARINQGLTQTQAAKAVGVHAATLRHWEKGRTFPTAEQYRQLCQLYGCPLDAVFLPYDSL